MIGRKTFGVFVEFVKDKGRVEDRIIDKVVEECRCVLES